MQQMNKWLDQEQSGHFSSLLQVESEFIEVALSANYLLRAVRADKSGENYHGVIAVYASMLDEKLKLFDAMLKRRDQRLKDMSATLRDSEEDPLKQA